MQPKRNKNIFVNKKHWGNMNEFELENFIYDIFQYYRKNGFPYYSTKLEYRNNEFSKLKKFNFEKLWCENIIGQSMHGLGLAWSYFPHSFNVKCNDKMTAYEAFSNDDIFKKVIRKRLKMGTYISDSGIRKMLKIYTGVQGVSNFRPTAAACIYNKYAKNGVVWDMSSGWGGRLLGAIIGGVNTYIGTEPSKKTFDGLVKLTNDFSGNMKHELNFCGSEEYIPPKDSLDLCFTSPPYFNLEKYSNEITQSYLKFPTLNDWFENFLKKTFLNCYYGLKRNGFLIINIADRNKNSLNLEKSTIQTANDVGFKLEKIINMALSNINLHNKNDRYKYEPIFVFQKKIDVVVTLVRIFRN